MLNNINHIINHSICINDKKYIIDIINVLNNKKISKIKDLISYLQINDNYLNIYKNYFILYNNRLISNEIELKTLFYDKKYKTNIFNI